jgi:hypothetical protein
LLKGTELKMAVVHTAYSNGAFMEFLDKNGMLWNGTRYGLHKFDLQKGDFAAHYYEKDGLASNFILKILSDDADRLWLLTDRGISIFEEQAAPGKLPSLPGIFLRPYQVDLLVGCTYPTSRSTASAGVAPRNAICGMRRITPSSGRAIARR